mgnify:CR=1 FL=1
MDLANFLLARIAEEERIALGVRPGPRVVRTGDRDVERFLTVWHPDRVLDECTAKRAIVREHQGFGGICGTCGVRRPEVGERWPCRTLRLLAGPYAERPDFDEAWRA